MQTISDQARPVNPTTFTGEGENNIQHIQDAQYDMRRAYGNGSAGVLVSGTSWSVAGLVALYLAPGQAVWALLIGGALIHPVSVLVLKMFGATGAHHRNNPLGRLALEGTLFMLMCLPLAYALSFQKVEWFFQGMLLVIGGRYLTFSTLYGTRLYWILGLVLACAAYGLFVLSAPAHLSLFAGSAIELTFGLVLLALARREKNKLKLV